MCGSSTSFPFSHLLLETPHQLVGPDSPHQPAVKFLNTAKRKIRGRTTYISRGLKSGKAGQSFLVRFSGKKTQQNITRKLTRERQSPGGVEANPEFVELRLLQPVAIGSSRVAFSSPLLLSLSVLTMPDSESKI